MNTAEEQISDMEDKMETTQTGQQTLNQTKNSPHAKTNQPTNQPTKKSPSQTTQGHYLIKISLQGYSSYFP